MTPTFFEESTMKHLASFVLCLPLLTSCHVEDDYYAPPPPAVHGHPGTQYHGHHPGYGSSSGGNQYHGHVSQGRHFDDANRDNEEVVIHGR